jgi:hypothetical protein
VLFLGHLGIGSWLAKPWSKRLAGGWLLLGTCLPDIIDKPLYYVHSWVSGLRGADLGLIGGPRTLGHTGILLLILALTGLAGNRRSAAIALGVATHLLLDFISDRIEFPERDSGTLQALFFPFWSNGFAVMPYHNLGEHLTHSYARITLISGELLGALLLWREWVVHKVSKKKAPSAQKAERAHEARSST